MKSLYFTRRCFENFEHFSMKFYTSQEETSSIIGKSRGFLDMLVKEVTDYNAFLPLF